MKPLIQTCLLLSILISHPLCEAVSFRTSLTPHPSKVPHPSRAFALPPPEDIPEEILRTEIILEGRSPIDGKPLSAAEYEELKSEISQSSNSPQINSDIKQVIFLLQLRKALKIIIPFY